MTHDERSDPDPERRRLFWGGQVRSTLYLLGSFIAGWQAIRLDLDPWALILFLIFLALPWLETCPVCGKTWWSHRTGSFPHLSRMIFISRADCPDRTPAQTEPDG
jgi:hypothetical protein